MNKLFYPAILVTLMFFLSGIEKIYQFSKTSLDFSTKTSIPFTLSKLVISVVILLEIIAPIIIVTYAFTGSINLFQLFRLALISLILFTILATVMYHNPFQSMKNYHQFITHLSIIGGLIALYITEKK